MVRDGGVGHERQGNRGTGLGSEGGDSATWLNGVNRIGAPIAEYCDRRLQIVRCIGDPSDPRRLHLVDDWSEVGGEVGLGQPVANLLVDVRRQFDVDDVIELVALVAGLPHLSRQAGRVELDRQHER